MICASGSTSPRRNLAIGQDHDQARADSNQHELLPCDAVRGPPLDLGQIWRPGPGVGIARIDHNAQKVISWRHDHELGSVGLPFRTQARFIHPSAIKGPAVARAIRVDAAAFSGHRMSAPHARRLVESPDMQDFAAHHAGPAGPTRRGLAGGREWHVQATCYVYGHAPELNSCWPRRLSKNTLPMADKGHQRPPNQRAAGATGVPQKPAVVAGGGGFSPTWVSPTHRTTAEMNLGVSLSFRPPKAPNTRTEDVSFASAAGLTPPRALILDRRFHHANDTQTGPP
jgi:hypothetical protein